MINTNAQTGLNFQGVARTTNNVILASQAITIKLSILQGSAMGTAEYAETRRVTTNAQGLFTAVIGDTGAISTLGNFATINWKLTPKFLKIEMDAAAGTNFITMGTTQFQYVAYAQFAKSVDAENIVGIVPVTLGGTGVNSLTGLKTALTLDNVNNTTDLTKPISTLTQTALDLKLNAADTSKFTKQTWVDSSLQTKLKISDTTAMLSSRIAKDTISLSNRINLKANITDVTTSLLLKESTSNKSTAVDLGGSASSDVLYPTQKAVKEYVASNNAAGGVVDGGISTIKIADSAVTDVKIKTVSGSKVIGNITGNAATATQATAATTAGNITATTNTTLTSLSNLATVGTIIIGVWSGTSVAVEKGGTGATTASEARTNLGLANVDNTSDANKPVSTAVQSALDLKLNVSDTSLLNLTSRFVTKLNKSDTANLSARINSKSSLADTSLLNLTSRFETKLNKSDTASLSSRINAKLSKVDTASLSERINSKLNSTVFPYYPGLQKGHIMYWNGSYWVNLNPGTAGQVLKMSSAAEPVPVWGTDVNTSVPAFSPCGATISDIDGNIYNTVLIGAQCWTKENLRVRRYNNGRVIPFDATGGSGGISATWQNLTIGAHTIYANDSTTTPSNLTKYGYLYNWYAAKGIYTTGTIVSTDTLNICPSGWHVPSNTEWTTLTNELGGESVAGGMMKSVRTAFWNIPNSGATNESGFSALPGGYRVDDGGFNNVRSNAYFWSDFESTSSEAWIRTLSTDDGIVIKLPINKTVGASVRCIKN